MLIEKIFPLTSATYVECVFPFIENKEAIQWLSFSLCYFTKMNLQGGIIRYEILHQGYKICRNQPQVTIRFFLFPNFIPMPTVKFTYALRRYFSGLKDTPAQGSSIKQVLHEMEQVYPGIQSYILDEQGMLRKHVNIFIDGRMISDRNALSDAFTKESEIYIMQALSGG